jgi:4-amino-4-deoxy-L-arabinose transferase-like glycosyltransferase
MPGNRLTLDRAADLSHAISVGRQDAYGAVLLATLGCLVVAIYALAFEPYASPWVEDAPRYVEAARSLLRGEPLYNTIGLDGPRPMYLWPPGFSVLIAAVTSAGVPALTAAYLLSRTSVALLLPAVYWALYLAFGRPLALIAAALCFTSPGILANANLVATESTSLLIAVIAFGFTVRERFFSRVFRRGLTTHSKYGNSSCARIGSRGNRYI